MKVEKVKVCLWESLETSWRREVVTIAWAK